MEAACVSEPLSSANACSTEVPPAEPEVTPAGEAPEPPKAETESAAEELDAKRGEEVEKKNEAGSETPLGKCKRSSSEAPKPESERHLADLIGRIGGPAPVKPKNVPAIKDASVDTEKLPLKGSGSRVCVDHPAADPASGEPSDPRRYVLNFCGAKDTGPGGTPNFINVMNGDNQVCSRVILPPGDSQHVADLPAGRWVFQAVPGMAKDGAKDERGGFGMKVHDGGITPSGSCAEKKAAAPKAAAKDDTDADDVDETDETDETQDCDETDAVENDDSEEKTDAPEQDAPSSPCS